MRLVQRKSPEDRLATVRRRELCILCFRHLDTKRCWSLGKVDNCGVRGCARPHNSLLDDVLQNEEVMMVSALPGMVSVDGQVSTDGGRREWRTVLQAKRAI
jgi:hypothetical protein